MNILNAVDFQIKPNHDITAELIKFIDAARQINEDKTIVFETGTYYIDSAKCKQYMLYITNTVGDKEFSADETPHLNAVPFYFNAIDNLTFDGNDSIFIIDGKVTNIALENCKNITLKNIEIRHAHPDMHELKAVKVSPFYVDFEVDRDSQYKLKNNKLYFYGKDYCCKEDKKALNAHWVELFRKSAPSIVKCSSNPLLGAVKIKALNQRKIRAYYISTFKFQVGDCFYLSDVRRQFAGIFVNQCENVVLDNVKQRFNYSLALVLQDSRDVSILNSAFAPEKNSVRKMASVADFIQVCMCRGNIRIENNYFDGSGDDCLNVHGVHYKIIRADKNKFLVKFMHHQSHGYNPFHKSDEIAFINPKTLLEYGRTTVISSKMLNEYEIELEVESAENAIVGDAIENISACPNVYFENNKLIRVLTRGCLFTTRGKVVVHNNHFVSTNMSGIHLSDDASYWYESGMCRDVTIQNNVFDYCGQTPISIKPENEIYKGAVHKNIKIINNKFNNYKGYCIRAKATDDIYIKNNKFSSDKIIKHVDCNGITMED